jgi:hypothetical protein
VKADIRRVNAPDANQSGPVASPVPRGGYLAMGLILLALVLLSIYSNVQKARRDQIEKVTITPAAAAVSPSPVGP